MEKGGHLFYQLSDLPFVLQVRQGNHPRFMCYHGDNCHAFARLRTLLPVPLTGQRVKSFP